MNLSPSLFLASPLQRSCCISSPVATQSDYLSNLNKVLEKQSISIGAVLFLLKIAVRNSHDKLSDVFTPSFPSKRMQTQVACSAQWPPSVVHCWVVFIAVFWTGVSCLVDWFFSALSLCCFDASTDTLVRVSNTTAVLFKDSALCVYLCALDWMCICTPW